MDVPELMGRMADLIATVPGIASAHAIPPTTIEAADCPAVVLFWDGEEDTLLQPDAYGATWLPAIRARLYAVPVQGDTPEEFAVATSLITPLVDAFQRGTPDDVMPGLRGKVDRCQVTRIRGSLKLGYASSEFYGADLLFSVKFHRRPTNA